MQNNSKLEKKYWLIKINEELVIYQLSLFNKSNTKEEVEQIINILRIK